MTPWLLTPPPLLLTAGDPPPARASPPPARCRTQPSHEIAPRPPLYGHASSKKYAARSDGCDDRSTSLAARGRVCVLRERLRETLNSILGRRARLARAARGSRRREQTAHEARRRRRRTEHCASGLSERRRASQRGRFAAGSGHLHCCCSWDSLSMPLRQAGGSTVLAGCSGRDSVRVHRHCCPTV